MISLEQEFRNCYSLHKFRVKPDEPPDGYEVAVGDAEQSFLGGRHNFHFESEIDAVSAVNLVGEILSDVDSFLSEWSLHLADRQKALRARDELCDELRDSPDFGDENY